MQWSSRQPFVPPSFLDRLDRVRLRRAAQTFAGHGWAVAPGAVLTGPRFDCGRPGCPITGCHPAVDSLAEAATTDPGRVAAWWRRRPHNVLLTTGERFDVLEVPALLGRPVADRAAGPVAVTAGGRWMFLVRPGCPLRAELDLRQDVVRHGHGSWIPAPPSRMVEGPVRWVIPPSQVDWAPGDPGRIQEMLAASAARTGWAHRVPRQLSTLRRAA
ncbi:DNA primase [Actinoplanes sp. SE50]|uniref:bifunctional DNA primase/polymerase n=1 Tax=unclassified Actinoplanes TaxID=2626549 RepID=UPI00023EC20D|nr:MULTISPECIES: bifunctional DNA primase/polymerase [unclassified Actinoplanes]AEV82437.1 bifunctional DNA primase/polymerase [Actinoplanes sp. SE50/110]ATO80834.1 DNA primase [Actinoplanes sp. SE50]SLL98241.1 DNA primase [Actinoplanes sp. SE50/110]